MSKKSWDQLNTVRYYNYIQNIIDTRGQWNIPNTEYWEGHHIIPNCKGGDGQSKKVHPNIIRLYAHEHFIAHKILAEDNQDDYQLVLAWTMMAWPNKNSKTKRDFEITPEEYEEIKLLLRNARALIDRSGWDYSYLSNPDRIAKLKIDASNRRIYNNGIIEIHLFKDEPVPEGFVRGSLPNISWQSGLGKSYFNNGLITIRAFECPEGYVKGRAKK